VSGWVKPNLLIECLIHPLTQVVLTSYSDTTRANSVLNNHDAGGPSFGYR
jgi:hypothetical protein